MTNKEAIRIIKNVNANNNCDNCYYKYDVACEDCRVNTALKMAIEALENQKTGHWIELGCVGNDNYDFKCSECHHTDTQSKTVKVNYCWYCGAKMIEQQKSEDNNETD